MEIAGKEKRPDFMKSQNGEIAEKCTMNLFLNLKKKLGDDKVQTGEFGAVDMQVYIQNDGPVTLLLKVRKISRR